MPPSTTCHGERAPATTSSSSDPGTGPNLSLDRLRSERQVPPRIHLDLYAENQEAEIERLVSLGARVVPWENARPDADYVLLEDPEGNRFCVIDVG